MKLENINLETLLPLFMRQDAFDEAAAEAANTALQTLAEEIAKLSTFDALEKLSTQELDELASELNVLWYNKDFSEQSKRKLLAESDLVYMRLGTVKAVSDALSAVFGKSTVEEFYSYEGGRPHYFRVRVENPSELSATNEVLILSMLDKVKRKSQWLESIYAETQVASPLFLGAAPLPRSRHTITFGSDININETIATAAVYIAPAEAEISVETSILPTPEPEN